MLLRVYVTFLLIFELHTEKSEKMNCHIFKNFATYNYVCPPNTERNLELEVKPSFYIRFVCHKLELFDYSLVPQLNFGNSLVDFRIDNCPIPKNGFKDLLTMFGIQYLNALKINWMSSNESFLKEHFQGLEGLHEISLFENHVKVLTDNLFEYTPNLISLKLDQNYLTRLQDDIFQPLNVLVYLSLIENKISDISENTFRGLLNLKELDLRNNKIKHIKRGTFDHLPDLEKLFLSYNKLNSLEVFNFANLKLLRYIHIDRNELVNISRKIFENNANLEIINLEGNNNLVLDDDVFSQLVQINSVQVSFNGVKIMPEDLFTGSINLYEIFFESNNIRILPKNIFRNLVQLKILHLNNNEIDTLEPGLFQSLESLEVLNLSHNFITEVHKRLLEKMKNLKQLNFSFNRLRTIEPEMLSGKRELSILLLNNNIFDLSDTALDGLAESKNIKLINFANNSISKFPYKLMKLLVQNGDDVYNVKNVAGFQSYPISSKEIEIILENNLIPNVRFSYLTQENVNCNTLLAVDISRNSIFCDCKASDLVAYTRNLLQLKKIVFKHENLLCSAPSALENIPLDKLDENELSCSLGRNCTEKEECDCSYKSPNGAIVVDCSRRNITDIPKLLLTDMIRYYEFINLRQIDVHLEENMLQEGPAEQDGYLNVTKLFLQNNNISRIQWVPPSIKVLNLENNELDSLDSTVLRMLNESNITELHLGKNPWKCDCSTILLLKFLRDHISQIYNSTPIRCSSLETPLVNMDESLLCPIRRGHILLISSVILFCLIATITIVLLYLVYRTDIFVWLYSKDTCMWLIEEERIDKSKKYDAFVSFAHQDEDFVMEQLLPVLENGEHSYKLCVHVRDWIPGEYITKQIANSVKESRRTLIVLSSDFLKSMWGKMEFRTAHTAAMEEGRVRVIIIIYGDFDMTAVNDDLKSYMRTNTYIKWGDPWFWEKLRYALPRTRHRNKKPKRRKRRHSIDLGMELQ